jgi:hypothetical protein
MRSTPEKGWMEAAFSMINVLTIIFLSFFVFAGLLKEYLRELPQPVFSNCLYQMLVDAMGVFLPDDPNSFSPSSTVFQKLIE